MINSNKKNGSTFEGILANRLFEDGFWCHIFADKINGQPFDIIAIKGSDMLGIDCKDCKNGVFNFSRIEPNQIMAMEVLQERTEAIACFALNIRGSITMLSYDKIKLMQSKGYKCADLISLCEYGMTYDEFVSTCL